MIFDRNDAGTDSTAASIVDSGGTALAFDGDVSDGTAVRGTLYRALSGYGRSNIFVNDADVYIRHPLVDISDHQVHETVSINLKGIVRCTRLARPRPLVWCPGKIVNVDGCWVMP